MSDPLNYREISDVAVMSLQPIVSVFMLTYKHEPFIAQAIESVVSQVCRFPFELIIADDCSPDGTLSIALDYQRRYPQLIRVLTGDKNVGMHANSSRRLTTMRGRYMASCEGDDYWNHPRKLQMQVDLMSANPGMVACHTDYDREGRFRTIRNNHKRKGRSAHWLASAITYRELLRNWSVITATTMFDMDMYRAFRHSEFRNPQWPFGDYNLFLFASLNGTVGYIDESTATYRKVTDSSSNGNYSSRLRMAVATEECVDLFMSKYPIPLEEERSIRSRLKKRIYRISFYAERLDLMNASHTWLQDNGFRTKEVLHRIRVRALELKFPVRFLSAVKDFARRNLHSISS